MKKNQWFYGVLCLLISFTKNELIGQTSLQINANNSLPLYQDGKLYLKIKANSNTVVYRKDSITNDIGAEIRTTFVRYNVTKTEKPFELLNDAKLNKTYRISFSDVGNIDNFITDLQQISTIEYAEKVPAMYTTAVSNDPTQPYHLPLVNAHLASNIHIATGNAIVAIVDDAVLTTHEDLDDNIDPLNLNTNRDVADLDNDPNPPLSGSNAVTNSHFTHGTHVAGIAGAVTNNGIGIASVGWNNRLMCVKTRLDSDVSNGLPFAFDGLEWAAANGAHVINMSWGGAAPSQTDYNVVVAAKNNNIVLVAAAGNNYQGSAFYPAAYGEGLTGQAWEIFDEKLVVAVAAIDANNDISLWGLNIFSLQTGSNYGNWVDISAYGTNILSTLGNSSSGNPINNEYGIFSGTSMATPIVSGIVGIMRSFNMAKTANEIIDCLLYTANTDIYNSSTHPLNIAGTLGTGRVDADAALRCLGVGCNNPIAIIAPSSSSPYLCPGGNITLTANEGQSYLWSNGATTRAINITNAGVYSVVITFAGGCTASANITINTAPTVASISISEQSGLNANDGILCGVDFLNILANYGLSYQWNAFGATSQEINNITTGSIANTPFSQTFCVNISGVSGCVGVNSSACVTTTWLTPPAPPVITGPYPICYLTTGPISYFGPAGYQYAWTAINATPTTGNLQQFDVTFSSYQTTINLTITDPNNGCSSNTSIVVYQTSNPPVVNAGADVTVCTPASTQLNGSASNGSVSWSPAATLSCNTCLNPIATPIVTTTYTLTATDACGVTSDQVTVNVNPNPYPTISVSASLNTICAGQSTNLSASGAVSYVWPQVYLAIDNITVTPNTTTTYYVTGTDGNGCQATTAIIVTVLLLPVIIASATPNPICAGESTILNATGSSVSYVWNTGAITSQITEIPTNPNTTYNVTGTGANGCLNYASVIVTVNPLPVISAIANPTEICPGHPVTLTAAGVNSYIWDTGATTNPITVNPTASTTYVVTGTDANGCSGIGQVTVNTSSIVYDYPNGITITSSSQSVIDWTGVGGFSDGKIMIKGPVYVTVDYTIANETWYFGNDYTLDPTGDLGIPSSGVVVKPGVTLTMDGTTFTAAENCDMWLGVQVLGKPASLPTRPTTGSGSGKIINNVGISPAVIGKLVMRNLSIIQYAHTGVSCFEATQGFMPGQQPVEHGAGLLQASGNSQFKNNGVGVAFRGRTLINNNSFITNCKFICDAPLPDSKYAGEGTSSFITLHSIQRPNFKANLFTNTGNFTVDKRGTGINSFNASYTVTVVNRFNNLTKGINTNATGGIKNITINNNVFTNVQQAITTAGTNYDNIKGNTFNIPDESLLPTWGVYLNGTQGFNVSDANNFNRCTTCVVTSLKGKGVIVLDGNTFGGNVSRNTFTGLETGTQSEGNNGGAGGGLQLKCNIYDGNNFAIDVSPQYPTIGSLAPQGAGCAPNHARPANKFLGGCSSTESDIRSAINFEYYENLGNQNPSSCVSAIITSYLQCNPGTSDNCTPGGGCTTPACLQAQRNKMDQEQDLLKKKQMLHELIIGHILSNSPNADIVIKQLLQAWNTDETRKILVPMLIDAGEFVKAQNTLTQIPQNNTENINYHQLYNELIVLGQAGKTIDEMTLAQEQTIRQVANSSTVTKYHAQAVLEGASKEHYVRIPEKNMISLARYANTIENQLPVSEYANEPMLLDNYPNPFNYLTVIPYYLPDKALNGEIIITDVTGRIVQKYNLQNGSKNIVFNSSELGNGIYYYTMIVGEKMVNTKKMVFIK